MGEANLHSGTRVVLTRVWCSYSWVSPYEIGATYDVLIVLFFTKLWDKGILRITVNLNSME